MRTALLSLLVIAAIPAMSAEMDHSHMDHGTGHEPPARVTAAPEPLLHSAHGNDAVIHSYLLFNQLEATHGDSGTGLNWDARGWIGTDIHRLWLRSEGQAIQGHTEVADLQLLYGQSVSAWWDVVAGVRHDFKPGESRTFGAFGLQGLAPLRIEISATAYVSEDGEVAARIEAEHQLLITNRFILQPRIEADFHGRTDTDRGLGAGLSTLHVGLRLRHESSRQFAPYIGADWERALGRTATLRRNTSREASTVRVVAGVRMWF